MRFILRNSKVEILKSIFFRLHVLKTVEKVFQMRLRREHFFKHQFLRMKFFMKVASDFAFKEIPNINMSLTLSV